jgi:hypothetical protein
LLERGYGLFQMGLTMAQKGAWLQQLPATPTSIYLLFFPEYKNTKKLRRFQGLSYFREN